MLGPIGSEIMSIFRLLSPDEIDKYIVEEKANSYKTGEVTAIAAGAEGIALATEHANLTDSDENSKFPKDHQAKIIPLHGEPEEEKDPYKKEKRDSNEHDEVHTKSSGNELESIGVMSAKKVREIERMKEEAERKSRDSATVFLLKERERLKDAKRKMIEQVAIKSYQVNAAQEFYDIPDEDIDLESDEPTDELKGILLNKKHY